jgi:hypothetical protein
MGCWGLFIAKIMIHLSYDGMDVSFMVQVLSTKYSLKVVKDVSFVRLMKHTKHFHSTYFLEKKKPLLLTSGSFFISQVSLTDRKSKAVCLL